MTPKISQKLSQQTDGPWQMVLDHFFESFVRLCFPHWATKIDWSVGYKVLKGEFPTPEGKRICDMLFEVKLLTGEKQVILLHFEIQGQKQTDFEQRMLHYNWTIFRKYQRPVISTAILLDDNLQWRPSSFLQENPFTGTLYHQFSFEVVKIIDYKEKRAELEKEKNIFALVILAQLAIMEAKNNYQLRRKHKLALTRELFNRGLDKKKISSLYQFIDWLIKLDSKNMQTFEKEITELSERESWQDWDPIYINTFEQVGMERGIQKGFKKGHQKGHQKGRQEGRQEGRREAAQNIFQALLLQRFPKTNIQPYLQSVNQADEKRLMEWTEQLLNAHSAQEIFQ